VRVLGKSEAPTCEWRGTMIATGNNISLVGDMTRRGMTIKLDAKSERPERRAFYFDPVQEILKERGKYVAAALTIVKAYMREERKIVCDSMAGFDDWSRLIREAILWIGMADPAESMEEARAADPARNAAAQLIEFLRGMYDLNTPFSTPDLIAKAGEGHHTNSFEGSQWEWERPEFRDFLLSQVCTQRGNEIEPRRLGRWMVRLNGQIHNGHCIVRWEGQGIQNKFVVKEAN
jgi:putative DNA primase/helicase